MIDQIETGRNIPTYAHTDIYIMLPLRELMFNMTKRLVMYG